MKVLSGLIAIFFAGIIGLIVYFNISNIITFEVGKEIIKANVGFLCLSSSILGAFISVFFLIFNGTLLNMKSKQIERKFENVKLKHEIESDKVKQLEAKIKTLEKALETLSG